MEEHHQKHYRERRGVLKLWLGALLAPLAWFVQLMVVYGDTPHLCDRDTMVAPFVVSAVAALLAAVGIALSLESWQAVGRSLRSEGPDVIGRTRLFGLVGVGGSVFFLIVILVQALPLFLTDPCG